MRIFPSVLVTLSLQISACAINGEQTLFQQLGGEPGIERIVDNLLFNIADDPVLRPLFEKTDLERFHEKLSEQLCELSDGPCRYTGDDMTEVHAGMAINNRHFDALVTALNNAMSTAGVGFGARNALLARLAELHEPVLREAGTPD